MNTTLLISARSPRLLLVLAALTIAACSDSSAPPTVTPPTVSPPITPPNNAMVNAQPYTLAADDRLVVTSIDPALVRVELILNEASGEDTATATLLEGDADLFQ